MYVRITKLPNEDDALASPELKALAQVWDERRAELEKTGVYQEFLKRLQREWAIETGIIERLYSWDRGVTEVLIEQGIDASLIAHRGGVRREEADHIKYIIEDQLAIVEGLFSFVKGEQPLTEHFIRSVQAHFTEHQDSTEAITDDGQVVRVKLLKGEYKKLPNNPRRSNGTIHEYCPPELVKDEMERLMSWCREMEEDTPPEVLSAWLHHRFAQIHPFQDGNGRVGRTLASLVFLKAGLFPLVIRDSDRKNYIAALETADKGDIGELVTLFGKRQRDSILTALGLEQQAQRTQHAEQIIQSAIRVMRDRFVAERERKNEIYGTADRLRAIASARFMELEGVINDQFAGIASPGNQRYSARAQSAGNDSTERHYFYHQIVEVARKLGYYANLERYRAWTRLSIYTEESFEIVLSFHGYGHGETGVMATSAFTGQRIPREEGGTDAVNTHPSSPELFQFNYAEAVDSTERRFSDWLEEATAVALAVAERLTDRCTGLGSQRASRVCERSELSRFIY